MTLYEVALIFDEIENVSSRLVITEKLASIYKQASAQEAKIISYLVLGSLLPPYQAAQLNIADKTAISILSRACDISEDEIKQSYKKSGDIGLVAYDYLPQRISKMQIEDLYDLLISYTSITGAGSIELKVSKFAELLQGLDALSAKYIVRIVTKTLRLGFSDMTVLDALSWMYAGDKTLKDPLEKAYNLCADLGLVAYTLKAKGIEGITSITPQVGIPIRPAAAERLGSAQEIIEKIGPCAVQPKLDGFRIQIHMQKKSDGSAQIEFFSRNLVDMSDMFPDIKKMLVNIPVDSIICEGEAIGYNPVTGEFLPFQETVKRKRKHDIEQASVDVPLRLYLFDMLYINGKSVMHFTHAQRRSFLEKALQGNTPDVYIIQEKIVANAKELENYFFECMSAGLEGIVAKRTDAIYQPGKRNFNWIKLKRHEERSLVEDTIDAVILGYYTGQGKRSEFGIGAFLVGIYNEKIDMFQTIAKVGTGLTDEEWKTVRAACDKIKVAHALPNVQVPKELQPDVWVYPEIVCEIRCDNITKSPVHTAGKISQEDLGYALRFPRFLGYRTDKSAYHATTVKEIVHLYEQQFSNGK